MSIGVTRIALSLSLTLVSTLAFAVQPYPAFSWSDSESSYATRCEGFNEHFKSHITCKIDHSSFDKHFAAEKKIPKAADRDSNDPIFYCGVAGIGFFDDETPGSGGQLYRDKDFNKEFTSKVKSVICQFSESKEPGLTLKNGVLTMLVTGHGSVNGGPAWMMTDVRKLFPSADAIWKENH